MLPDFPQVKTKIRRIFFTAVQKRIPHHSPILDGIGHFRVHEGREAFMTRGDASEDRIEFEPVGASIEVSREQMRRITVEELLNHISTLAEQLASEQSRLLFARVGQAVEEVGNSVSAAEIGTKAAFLEMNRRLEVDFDPSTLEPKNQVIVLHPSQVQAFIAQVQEWEKDPIFVQEMAMIRQQQIEAWRARENNRKLVD